MAGEVDRERRPPEAEGDGVPGVGVLRPAVHEDHLGRRIIPPQRADDAGTVVIGADCGVDPFDFGNLGDRQRVLGDVLVEEAELVVVDHGVHVVT